MVAQFFVSFPDSYTHIENVMTEGDWAAWEWVGGGTFLRAISDRSELRGKGLKFAAAVSSRSSTERSSFNVVIGTRSRGTRRLVCL